jgi:hypothetical protein
MIDHDDELFSGRPSRSHVCHMCRGRGRVPDPYCLAPVPASLVPGAPPGAVTALVRGASSIFESTAEAAELARRSSRPVAFDFTGHLVVVLPGDDPVQVARAWWLSCYGETPEESAARR